MPVIRNQKELQYARDNLASLKKDMKTYNFLPWKIEIAALGLAIAHYEYRVGIANESNNHNEVSDER